MPALVAAAYARYSTDHQCSIEVQFAMIQKFCRNHDIYVPPSQMYEDEALTGTHVRMRKGYKDLVRAAENHEFDCVVLYDLTRGSRDVVDWFSFRKTMKALGIQVFCVIDKLGDLDNPSDFLTELVTVGMGQTQVLTARMKSMDKIDLLASKGKFLGGYAPLGYRIKDGQYIIDPVEAGYVHIIFTMYADGSSYDDILASLPAGLRGKRGRPLGRNSLHEILKNERYTGKYTWCKRKVKYMSEWAGGGPSDRAVTLDGIIPPLVDQVTWERVQKRMDANKHNTLNNSRRHRDYLLTGLLRCGHCGAALVGITSINKKGYEHKYYACGNKWRCHTCKAKNIAANDIEPLVVSLLRHSLLDGSMIEATADAILAAGRGQNNRSELTALKNELAELDKEVANLTDVLASGLDSPAVRARLVDFEGQRNVLGQKIKELRPKPELSRDYLIQQLTADARELQNNPSCIKELLRKYIIKIDVYDDAIEIHSTADFAQVLPLVGISPENARTAKETLDSSNGVGCGSRI